MPTTTISKLQTGFFRPPHVRGDRDFWGHGPRTQGSVTLSIEAE